MRRREFITLLGGAAVQWPVVAWAQQRPGLRTVAKKYPGGGAMLRMRGRFTDTDVADVAQLALTGLAHQRRREAPRKAA